MDRKQSIAHLSFLTALLPVVEAYTKGAEVQYHFADDPNGTRWYDTEYPSFLPTCTGSGREVSWRVKPKPVELTVWVCQKPHTEFDDPSQPGIVYKPGDMQMEPPTDDKYLAFWKSHKLVEKV